jgi:hypothetical protein
MKDIYRNPILYYIVVPVLVALWPLLVWAVYLPNADDAWEEDTKQYEEGLRVIKDILGLDGSRLDNAAAANAAERFEYAIVIDKITRSCGISSRSYKLSSKDPRISKAGQETQSCRVSIEQVDIGRFAKFLSTLQLQWPNLECETLKLTKVKGLPDAWKAELDFAYSY